jgi:Fe-S-cluster-containing dehydrogenase component
MLYKLYLVYNIVACPLKARTVESEQTTVAKKRFCTNFSTSTKLRDRSNRYTRNNKETVGGDVGTRSVEKLYKENQLEFWVLIKNYDRKDLVEKKKENLGRESQGAWREEELIGSKPPVVM